ncbi:Non-heme 11 kDa protein of cytochrome bc1 complex [Serendipita vermifera]|nr:Non-heme 11 kDa protein of cytochrome bc1 complex [Serendipita vermifera]
MLSEFFSSLIPKAYAEEQQQPAKEEEKAPEAGEEKGEEEAQEEPEPEDPAPAIREECSETPECKPSKRHFEHCVEKVSGGQGFPHEDCVEEMFHLMHCVDHCAAPKVFAKLK